MPVKTNVNNKTVVHSGSTGTSIAFPDPCKTPTPGGPVPIPYPNVAQSSDATATSTTVKMDGTGIMLEDSKFAQSTGDEAGSAGGGVVSNQIKGAAKFQNFSFDVKVEGKKVPRLADPMVQNMGAQQNAVSPAEIQGPLVTIAASGVGKSQEEACDKLKEKEVKDHKKGAKDAGMLEDDYEAIRKTCRRENATISFRDTNPACAPHLAAGVPSKGHDVLQKTWESCNLPADKQGMAGLVSDLFKKPPRDHLCLKPNLTMQNGKPLTGDYDMMDVLDGSGRRIQGESPRDLQLRDSLNRSLPHRGQPPGPVDRIKHGAQSEYANYLEKHPGEAPCKDLFKPEKPLTVFDKDGKVYRLESHEDVMNFYKCKGAEIPANWNLEFK